MATKPCKPSKPRTPAKTKRAYQTRAIAECVAVLPKYKRVLLHAFMGAGKTYMAVQIAKKLGYKVYVLAHRRQLVSQLQDNFGPSGFPRENVMTRQRLARRLALSDEKVLIVIDEAHWAAGSEYQAIIAAFPKALVLGLSATPMRLDRKPIFAGQEGNGEPVFKHRVQTPGVQALAKLGAVLIPTHYTSEEPPDLSDVRVEGGDYATSELEKRLIPLVGELTEHWRKFKKQALVFAAGVRHAEAIVNKFTKEGISAVAIHSQMGQLADSNRTLFETGTAQVAVAIGMLTEGFDMPSLAVVMIARPTLSRPLAMQMIGRVMRPFPGKSPVVLDHAGIYHMHGMVQDAFDYATGARAPVTRKRCVACGAMNDAGSEECEACGASLVGVGVTLTRLEAEAIETDDALRKAEEIRAKEEAFVNEVRRKQDVVREHLALPVLQQTTAFAHSVGVSPALVHNFISTLRKNPHHTLAVVGDVVKHGKTGATQRVRTSLTASQRAAVVRYAQAFLARKTDKAVAQELGIHFQSVGNVRTGKTPLDSVGLGHPSSANRLNAKYPRTSK